VGKPLSGNCCISVLYVAAASRKIYTWLDFWPHRKGGKKQGKQSKDGGKKSRPKCNETQEAAHSLLNSVCTYIIYVYIYRYTDVCKGVAAVERICFNKSFAAKLNEMLAGLSHSRSYSLTTPPRTCKDLRFGPSSFPRQDQDMNMFPCSYNVSTAKLCLRKWGKRNETRTSKEVVDIYARGIRKNAFQLKQVCNNLNVCLAVGKRVHTELQITRSVLDNWLFPHLNV